MNMILKGQCHENFALVFCMKLHGPMNAYFFIKSFKIPTSYYPPKNTSFSADNQSKKMLSSCFA